MIISYRSSASAAAPRTTTPRTSVPATRRTWAMVSSPCWAFRERLKWDQSERQLPGTLQKNNKRSKAGYFGWGKRFGKFWF